MKEAPHKDWKRVSNAWVPPEWNPGAYVARLKFFREYHGFGTQTAFASHLGLPSKKWSHYERGYPLPREAAWTLYEKYGCDVSIDWIWFGRIGSLSYQFWRAAQLAGVPQETRAEFDARMKRAA